jgi:phage minor structural protein
MIPILFDHDEVDFTSQGLFRLYDAVSCIVTEEENGIYECELKYPIDGDFFDEIFEGRIIGATHDDNGDIQPYEIYKYSAPIDGVVTFYAHHLSYRLRRYIIMPPFHASSCTEAMSMMAAASMNHCPFTFWTDVSTTGSFDIKVPTSIKSILAGDGNTILNTYGYGTFEFDKWAVKFHAQRGADHGVQIRYGKNLTDIKREYDASGVYTAVVPYYYKEDSDGTQHLVTLSGYGVIVHDESAVQHVYWTNENDEIIRDEQGHPIELAPADMLYEVMDLTSYFDEQPTEAALAAAAKAIFEDNQPWIPEDNISINFVALWQTPEYEDIAPLEKVSMGDYVHVIYTKLGISVLSRVVKTVYNTILDRYDTIELGTITPSLAAAILGDTTSTLEKIQSQLQHTATADYVNEEIGKATDAITGGLGGYIKVTLNADNEPQEILIMDQPDVNQAVHVIRINQAGIGFSTTGYQGPFNSAWLIDGTFDAQVINVVNLAATVIRTGFLTDARGYNYWNLETGEFRLSSTSMIDTYQETSYTATRPYAVGDKIEVKLENDTLIYEVTTAIPVGGTIAPGSNVKAATAHTLLDFARKAETIQEVDVEYASHTSSITPPPEDSPLWSTESPDWELGKYIWQRTKMIDGNNATNYSDPVCIQGAQGTNSAVIYLYKRSATAATIDWTQNLTYSFATNKLTSLPNGWVDNLEDLLENDNPIYMTAATAGSRDATDTIPYTEWAEPVIMAQNGADAPKTAVVVLYKRSNTVPTKPSITLTYTFETAQLSGTLDGWSQTIPAADGNPCYSIQAVAISVGATDTIPSSEWSDVRAILSDGLDGRNTATVYLYKRSATVPTKPTVQTTYTFASQLLDPVPSGWSRGYIGGSDPLYIIAATASSTEDTDTIAASEWSDPVILTQDGAPGSPGADGKNTATIRLYKRSATAPTIDWSNALTYDFTTNSLTSLPTGWTADVPDGDDDLYATAATASSTTDTDTINANEWATPVCITKNGLSWSSAAVFLYARAANSSDLTKPTQALDYTFSTGKLSRNGQTSGVLGQWSQEIPTSDGNPCFVIQATAVSDDGQTDTIQPNEWSDIARLVSDGAAGSNGRNTAIIYLYKRSPTAPSIDWQTSIVYTFATNSLSDIPTGWSRDIPSGTDPLYVTAATASSTDATDSIPYTEWSAPIMMAKNGEDGAAAEAGLNSATVFLYARAANASALSKPSSALTYTFATGILASIPSPWQQTIPASDGNPCFVIQATAVNKEATDSIAASEWSEIVELVSDGDDGTPGVNTATVFLYARAASASALTKPTGTLTYNFSTRALTPASRYSGWSTTIPDSDGNPCFVIQATAVGTGSTDTIGSGEWSDIAQLVADGEDGRSIVSITEYYARNNSTTAPADSAFSTSVVNPTSSNKYLWNYEEITYSSGEPTKTAKRIIGTYGQTGGAGKGISSITNYYLATASGSGVTTDTPGWTTTVQSMTPTNKYLWNYESIAYTSGDPTTTTPTIIGVYGDTGKGISSIQEQYYLSTSKTSATGGSWQTTQPAWSEGHYIWTRSKITWSDSTTSYTTAICCNAINGANEAVEALDDELTQQEIFNRLTNNSNNEGVYLENGRLYLNATMLATGVIQDRLTTPYNKWNLNTGYFQTTYGHIADFNIGASKYDSSHSWSSLYYMSDLTNGVYDWSRPYSAAYTPIRAVGLRGNTSDTNLGFTFISQGRMYVNGSSTNYCGRVRMNAGMMYWDVGLTPSSATSGWSTVMTINPFAGTGGNGLNMNGTLAVSGNFAATGSKSRIVETEDYGRRLLYAYETPTPHFGDIGEGEIGEDGLTYIWFDPIFEQTIEDCQYQVFLQKYGAGDCYVIERKSSYFVVQGTPGLTFGWEIKAKQAGYVMTRLGDFREGLDMPLNQDDFVANESNYLQNLREGREST